MAKSASSDNTLASEPENVYKYYLKSKLEETALPQRRKYLEPGLTGMFCTGSKRDWVYAGFSCLKVFIEKLYVLVNAGVSTFNPIHAALLSFTNEQTWNHILCDEKVCAYLLVSHKANVKLRVKALHDPHESVDSGLKVFAEVAFEGLCCRTNASREMFPHLGLISFVTGML